MGSFGKITKKHYLLNKQGDSGCNNTIRAFIEEMNFNLSLMISARI